MEISFAEIIKNREMIRSIWTENFIIPIDIIEYRSCSEAHGGLSLAIGYKDKDSLPDFFTAFVTIWLKDLEFWVGGWQGWQDRVFSYEDADLILDRYLMPEAANWKVAELTSSRLKSEFEWRSQTMKEMINIEKKDDRISLSPGIYANDVPVQHEQEFNPPVLLDTYRSGIILEIEWNQVTYFVETSSGFVYYDWGTSA